MGYLFNVKKPDISNYCVKEGMLTRIIGYFVSGSTAQKKSLDGIFRRQFSGMALFHLQTNEFEKSVRCELQLERCNASVTWSRLFRRSGGNNSWATLSLRSIEGRL